MVLQPDSIDDVQNQRLSQSDYSCYKCPLFVADDPPSSKGYFLFLISPQ